MNTASAGAVFVCLGSEYYGSGDDSKGCCMSTSILDATSFWALLTARSAATPDQVLLIDDAGRSLTCAEFLDQVERVAAGFHGLGIGDGTPVTWVLPTRIETVVASFALSRLGATQNPIIHIYRHREVGFCLRQTGAEFVLHPGEWGGFDYQAMIEDVTADLDRPPRLINGYSDLPTGDPASLPPAPEYLPGEAPVRWRYYTSGTTSDPKGVLHTDQTLIAAGTGLGKALEVGPDDVGSVAFPYAHIGGPDYIVMMLVFGHPAVFIERFTPGGAVAAFAEHGVTMAGGSTAFYQMFLAEDQKVEGPVMPRLRLMAGGGAPKPPEVFFAVKEGMGVPIVHGYGMTECPMICNGSPSDSDQQLATTEGAPIDGCQVSVVNPDGTDAGPGVEGEVRVAGPMLFKGYTDPSLEADAFDGEGRFRTGDLGIRHADGHVTLTGRLKDIIIRKGENISAAEIENVLYGLDQVENAAVIGLPDVDRGERVCAVVETAAGHPDLTFDEMVQACRDAGLMTQKIPEQLEVHDGALPRNATMKILKFELRDRYKEKAWP
jgi:cyclohexanecarboxylate-CoA ligase